MKKCPYCAEEIQDEAIICRFCKRDLPVKQIQTNAVQSIQANMTAEQPKKRRIRLIFLIAGILFLIICCVAIAVSPPDNDKNLAKKTNTQAVVVAGAESKTDSNTQAPSDLPKLPTETKTPKPTSTSTPRPTETFTPLPPEALTGTAVGQTKEAKVAALTATKKAQDQAVTGTAVAVNKTKEAKGATATEVASYKEINWKELDTYADNHIGERVIVRGRVFNVVDDTTFQIFYAGTYEAAFITMLDPYTGLYEDNSVIVYGIVLGKGCGTNAFGGEVCQAQISGVFFGK